jgi:hypothetical protein
MQTARAGGEFVAQVKRIWNNIKPVVIWFGRAVVNVGKFAAKHPNLVKVATALFLASKALKLMRFGSAIRGAQTLYSGSGSRSARARRCPRR